MEQLKLLNLCAHLKYNELNNLYFRQILLETMTASTFDEEEKYRDNVSK